MSLNLFLINFQFSFSTATVSSPPSLVMNLMISLYSSIVYGFLNTFIDQNAQCLVSISLSFSVSLIPKLLLLIAIQHNSIYVNQTIKERYWWNRPSPGIRINITSKVHIFPPSISQHPLYLSLTLPLFSSQSKIV